MMNSRVLIASGLFLSVFSQAASAADKSSYSLFKRTPENELRELSTDRPDKTESPYSVDAGWFQVESSLGVLGKDADSLDLAEVNFKVGLSQSTDLQAVFIPFQKVGEETGYSDLTFRFKWNLMGNDEGDLAVALMPYVSLPVGKEGFSTENVDLGIAVPVAVGGLPAGFSLGLMGQLDVQESGNHLSTMATLGHDIVGDLAGYVEFFNTLPDLGTDGWVATLDTGLTYALTPAVQLDAGVNWGLTDTAESIEAFIGVSARF